MEIRMFIFSCTRMKIKPLAKMGLFRASKGDTLVFFTKSILNFHMHVAFQIQRLPFSMSFIWRSIKIKWRKLFDYSSNMAATIYFIENRFFEKFIIQYVIT